MLAFRLAAVLAAATLGAGVIACGEKEENLEPPTADDFAIAGNWAGTLNQQGLAPFLVAVRIQKPNAGIPTRVAYTGIGCGGTWTFVSLEGGAYRFREEINQGTGGNCKGTGEVTLTPDPAGKNELAYRFRGGGVTSSGVLTATTAAGLKATFAQAGVALGGR